MTSFEFAGQYQQNPAPIGGGLVKKEWMQFSTPPHLSQMRRIVLSWDSAFKTSDTNAYSACAVVGVGADGKYYLL